MTERSLSYRNQFIDLQSKSMDWFLYDRDHRHERAKLLENYRKNNHFCCESVGHPVPLIFKTVFHFKNFVFPFYGQVSPAWFHSYKASTRK